MTIAGTALLAHGDKRAAHLVQQVLLGATRWRRGWRPPSSAGVWWMKSKWARRRFSKAFRLRGDDQGLGCSMLGPMSLSDSEGPESEMPSSGDMSDPSMSDGDYGFFLNFPLAIPRPNGK